MAVANTCVFCRILEGSEPASFVYRDETVAAFMTIQPVNPGHVLIVPVQHAETLADLPPHHAARIMQIAQQLATAIHQSAVRSEGLNLWLSDGPAAGQAVPHFHLHVIPRFQGDGFGFTFGPGYKNRPERSELDNVARNIKEAM